MQLFASFFSTVFLVLAFNRVQNGHSPVGSTHMLLLAREKPDPQSRQELRSRKFKLNSKLSFYTISMLLLLCAGDIESNPGPSVDPTQLSRFVNAAEILVGSSVAISDLTSGIYDASILKVDNDRFFAHFRGWNKSSDSWVNLDQIFRLPDGYVPIGRNSRGPICLLASPVSSPISVALTSSPSRDAPVSSGLSQEMSSMMISAELAESAVPDLSDVMSSRVDTVRFVPISLRNEWSEVVGHALDNCATAPDNLKNWTRLLMLPKYILKAPRRGGKSHAANNCRAFAKESSPGRRAIFRTSGLTLPKDLKSERRKTANLLLTLMSAEPKS